MATATPPATEERADLHAKYLAERDKRLRRDSERQFQAAEGALAEFDEDPHASAEQPRDPVEREVDTLIVGGGFGGLLTAARLMERGADDFLLVERGADVGGTWYWNRYPGVRCDIESYVYMPLLEEVGTIPSERYATGAEILDHCRAIARHYGVYERALLRTRVTRMDWDDVAARWCIETDRGDRITSRFVTVSQGPLAKVKLPGIPGIADYTGPIFHTSRWDYALTGEKLEKLEGRRVAVIGTGATAIQVVPQLAEVGAEVYLFQRTPSAVDERNNSATDADWFRSQPRGWLNRRRDNFLAVITAKPHETNEVGDRWTDFWTRFGRGMADAGKVANDGGPQLDPHSVMQTVDYAKMDELRARVGEVVADPDTAERLKPWYNYLCKRPLYSDHFLQAMNLPNVHLVDTDGRGVERITAGAVVANGTDYPADLVVLATGFDVGAPPHEVGGYEVSGRGGAILADKWAAGLRSVHGTQMAGLPNFHLVGGTEQGTTAFNFTHTLDMQAVHAAEIVVRCLAQGIDRWEVTREAEERWLAELQAKHVDHQHFYEECTPGFLNNEGDFKDRPTFVGGTYGAGPIAYEALITAWRENGWRDDVEVERIAEKV